MAAKRVKDLAVKVGTYQKDGETKSRFENIGAMMESDDGSFFLFIKKTFNPAGVPTEEGRESILVSVFDLKDGDAPRQSAPQRQAPSQAPANDFDDDDIPF